MLKISRYSQTIESFFSYFCIFLWCGSPVSKRIFSNSTYVPTYTYLLAVWYVLCIYCEHIKYLPTYYVRTYLHISCTIYSVGFCHSAAEPGHFIPVCFYKDYTNKKSYYLLRWTGSTLVLGSTLYHWLRVQCYQMWRLFSAHWRFLEFLKWRFFFVRICNI